MIFGVFPRNDTSKVDPQAIERILTGTPNLVGRPHVQPWERGVFGYRSPFRTQGYQELVPAVTHDRQFVMVFVGQVYNEQELRQEIAVNGATSIRKLKYYRVVTTSLCTKWF